MKTRKQKYLLAVFLAICGVRVTAHAEDKAPFYACYTRLDYDQPQDPALLGRSPSMPPGLCRRKAGPGRQGPRAARDRDIRWGKYADLVVNVAAGRQLVFSRATGYLPYLQTPKGRFPFKPLAECRQDPLCLCSYVRLVEDQARADRRPLAACAGPGQRRDDRGRSTSTSSSRPTARCAGRSAWARRATGRLQRPGERHRPGTRPVGRRNRRTVLSPERSVRATRPRPCRRAGAQDRRGLAGGVAEVR